MSFGYENRVQAQFDGEHYESITEATWAGYLKAVDMPFHHQPATFRFPGITWYTPDFYLPEQQTFVEVKKGNLTDRDVCRMNALTYFTNRAGMIIDGRPGYSIIRIYTPEWTYRRAGKSALHADVMFEKSTNIYLSEPPAWMPDQEADPDLWLAITNAIEFSKACFTTELDGEVSRKFEAKINYLEKNFIDYSKHPTPEGYDTSAVYAGFEDY